MRRMHLAAVLCVLGFSSTHAHGAGGEGLGSLMLVSDTTAIGVHRDGSLVNEIAQLGVLWDPDGPNGEIPVGGDILLPGKAFDVWSLTTVTTDAETTSIMGGPFEQSDLECSWSELEWSSSVTWLEGTCVGDNLNVDVQLALSLDIDVLWWTVSVTANEDFESIWLARTVDPDIDASSTGSHDTNNEAGDGWAVAEGDEDQRAWAMASAGATGGVCSWCVSAEDVLVGASGPVSDDLQIGLALDLGALDSGASVSATVVYAFAVGADEAVSLAQWAVETDDWDGDGVNAADGDCDDLDPDVAEGISESADGIDNDCDGEVDEDTSWSDDDGDGASESEGDCDDTDATVGPDSCDEDSNWPPEEGESIVVTASNGVEARGCSTSRGTIGWWFLPFLLLRRRP